MAFGHRSILLLAALLTASCGGTATRRVDPTILALEGEVRLQNETDSPAITPLRAPSSAAVGSTLQTAAESQASVSLLPGALLELQPRSAIRLDELKLGKDGNLSDQAMRRRVAVTLQEGTILLLVQFESGPGECEVKMPGANIQITAPALCLLSAAAPQLRLICIRGNFSVTANGRASINVEAGSVYLSSGQTTTPFPAESDLQAQAEIDKSLDLERKLLGLQDRARNSPFYRRTSYRSGQQELFGTAGRVSPDASPPSFSLKAFAEVCFRRRLLGAGFSLPDSRSNVRELN